MSTTMARPGGQVQPEQSDLHLALNMATIHQGGFLHATKEEMQYRIKTPCTEVPEEKKHGVVFPGQGEAKTAMERHPAMLHQNHTDECLLCQHSTAKNPQTFWMCKGTCAPPLDIHGQPTPDPMGPLPSMPPMSPGHNERVQSFQANNLSLGYLYTHTPYPSAQFVNRDACAQNSHHGKDFNHDMLTNEGASTG